MDLCAGWRRILVFGLAAVPLRAEWVKLTTPHFEMYTTNTRAKALAALEALEQARAFFDENSASQTVTDSPIRIIAFQSEKEFRPYSANPGAIAFYQRGNRRDYIVMRDLGPSSYSVAIHEYTHLYLDHRNLKLPLWLNEGLADVYSTLQMKGAQLMLGAPPAGRWEELQKRPLLDVHELLLVDQRSPYYRQPEEMSQFYAESWALAHMLLLGKGYRENFRQFVAAVNEGKGSEAAFRAAYGKTLNEVAADLRKYIAAGGVSVSWFPAETNRRDVPEVSGVADREAELVLADLLSIHRDTAAEAQARLSELAAEAPKDPEVQRSLGDLAWQQGKVNEAREHFREAIEEGSRDAVMMLQYADLLRASGAPAAQIVPVLEHAIELRPNFSEARFKLGIEAASEGECPLALSALSAIKTISSDRAYPLYSVLAYCTFQQGKRADARHWAELARQYAGTTEQSANAERMLQELNRPGR